MTILFGMLGQNLSGCPARKHIYWTRLVHHFKQRLDSKHTFILHSSAL